MNQSIYRFTSSAEIGCRYTSFPLAVDLTFDSYLNRKISLTLQVGRGLYLQPGNGYIDVQK